jgi:hypothetical protein
MASFGCCSRVLKLGCEINGSVLQQGFQKLLLWCCGRSQRIMSGSEVTMMESLQLCCHRFLTAMLGPLTCSRAAATGA